MTAPGEKPRLLLCGASGFIGRNLLEAFAAKGKYALTAVYLKREPDDAMKRLKGVEFVQADLTSRREVDALVKGHDILIQAAATTSGAKDIVTRPHYHVTDNALMNSLIFRACHEHAVRHVVFFSCTTMYMPRKEPVREEDFDGRMIDKYFGVGWTKVYIEKMCEFYAKTGASKYTAIRHTNIYGPHDKFDLEKSHVFGATVAKVMTSADGKVRVWGDGSDERDLLYVDDLVRLVELALEKQETPFELVNAGSGRSVSVRELVNLILAASGRTLDVEYDTDKPSIGFKLAVDSSRAEKKFGWKAAISLEEGIRRTLDWYTACAGET